MRKPCFIVTCCSMLVITIILTSCTESTSETPIDLPAGLEEIENLTVYPAGMEAKADVRFDRERSFGDTPELPIGRMGGFAIDDKGKIYMSDVQTNTLHIFEADGKYLTSVGRSGNGPGEYMAGPFPTIISDQLFLLDIRRSAVNLYSIDDLELVRTININPTNKDSIDEIADAQFNQIFIINEETFLIRLSTFSRSIPEVAGELKDDKSIYFYLMGDDSQLTRPLIEPTPLYEITGRAPVEFQFEGPFSRVAPKPQLYTEPIVAISDQGEIYTAMSDHLLIRKHTADGDYQSAFYHPFDHLKMNREDAVNAQRTELIAEIVSQNEVPDIWPAMDNMIVDDDGRIWIATIVKDLDVFEWWVLEASGELITKFEWPRDEPIEVIKNGKMYTRETDEEMGLQRVVRYAIKL